MDPKQLLDSFLGSGSTAKAGDLLGQARGQLDRMGVPGGFAGGAAVGGLLALLLGGKKLGKVASYGGAAALGALAYRAYQNWQSQPGAPSVPAPAKQDTFLPSAAPAADGAPFELALIRAMVAAAAADGHIDATERRSIAAKIEAMGLDAEAKAFVFDAMNDPPTPDAIAQAARTPEQASQLWLAARLAATPDEPTERAFLDALAHRLSLPPPLVAELEKEIVRAGSPAQA
jgi:uncharacterized membrane protein YebE (DUF533 family)